MLLSGDGGGGRGNMKEVSSMILLLCGGVYRMLAPLWILILGFYVILCSLQIIYLNNVSGVKFSFDRRGSILHSVDIFTCWINRPFRKLNTYMPLSLVRKIFLVQSFKTKMSISHYLDWFYALLTRSSVRWGICKYSEIGYLLRNFVQKIQGVNEKVTLWYSRGVKRSGYTVCDECVLFLLYWFTKH